MAVAGYSQRASQIRPPPSRAVSVAFVPWRWVVGVSCISVPPDALGAHSGLSPSCCSSECIAHGLEWRRKVAKAQQSDTCHHEAEDAWCC